MLESIRPPLESRIYFYYPGQGSDEYAAGITLRQPDVVARLVDNPADPTTPLTQTNQYIYNGYGKLTQYIDSLGRSTSYDYYGNGIDLRDVRQTTGALNDQLLAFGAYNSQHRPSTITNASGMVYNFSWNSSGQLTNVVDPLSRQVIFGHDANGYLKTVIQTRAG